MLLLRDGLAEKFPLVGYNLQFAFVYSKYYSVKVYYTLSSILDNQLKKREEKIISTLNLWK